ncbi:unnamed protein product [Amoebophrya sp. A120]|nr:unnamed protein product [Amoebophrya sp. A120]|eukprot:GSA120T00017834001.1
MTDTDLVCICIAALLHDVGHPAFSHMFEEFMRTSGCSANKKLDRKKIEAVFDAGSVSEDGLEARVPNSSWDHEDASLLLAKQMFADLQEVLIAENITKLDQQFILELIHPPKKKLLKALQNGTLYKEWPLLIKGRDISKAWMVEIVSNWRCGLDVDRFDYFLRDAYHLGVKIQFDLSRYLNNVSVAEYDYEEKVLQEVIADDLELQDVVDSTEQASSGAVPAATSSSSTSSSSMALPLGSSSTSTSAAEQSATSDNVPDTVSVGAASSVPTTILDPNLLTPPPKSKTKKMMKIVPVVRKLRTLGVLRKDADMLQRDFFEQRQQLHKQAYQHRTTKKVEHHLLEILKILNNSPTVRIKNKKGEPVRLSQAARLDEKNWDPYAYAQLTDSMISTLLNSGGLYLAPAKEDDDLTDCGLSDVDYPDSSPTAAGTSLVNKDKKEQQPDVDKKLLHAQRLYKATVQERRLMRNVGVADCSWAPMNFLQTPEEKEALKERIVGAAISGRLKALMPTTGKSRSLSKHEMKKQLHVVLAHYHQGAGEERPMKWTLLLDPKLGNHCLGKDTQDRLSQLFEPEILEKIEAQKYMQKTLFVFWHAPSKYDESLETLMPELVPEDEAVMLKRMCRSLMDWLKEQGPEEEDISGPQTPVDQEPGNAGAGRMSRPRAEAATGILLSPGPRAQNSNAPVDAAANGEAGASTQHIQTGAASSSSSSTAQGQAARPGAKRKPRVLKRVIDIQSSAVLGPDDAHMAPHERGRNMARELAQISEAESVRQPSG